MALGTGTQALSTTAVQLPNHPCNEATVFNDDGAIVIKVGNASAQNASIAVGSNSGPIQVRNTNQLWVKSASGTPTCSFLWV